MAERLQTVLDGMAVPPSTTLAVFHQDNAPWHLNTKGVTWTKASNKLKVCDISEPSTVAASGGSPEASALESLFTMVRSSGGSNTDVLSKLDMQRAVLVYNPSARMVFFHRAAAHADQYMHAHKAGNTFAARCYREGEFVRGGVRVAQTADDVRERRAIVKRVQTVYPCRIRTAAPGSLPVSLPAGSPLRIQTVYHAVPSLEVAMDICSSGFASLADLDPGFYGRGLYFTHDLMYAVRHYGSADASGYKAVIVAQVVYAQPYPVLPKEGPPPYAPAAQRPEQLMGSALAPRHDAHVVFVSPSKSCLPVGVEDWSSTADLYSEGTTRASTVEMGDAVMAALA